MAKEKYFVLSLKNKKDPYANTDKIYQALENVKDLNIPFIPLKSYATGMDFENSKKETNLQIALPNDAADLHDKVFKFVSTVNNDIDVTLLGEQSKEALRTDVDPADYGLDHFVLGEKYNGLGK